MRQRNQLVMKAVLKQRRGGTETVRIGCGIGPPDLFVQILRPAHEDKGRESLVGGIEGSAYGGVKTVADIGNSARIDIGTRQKKIDTPANIHDLLRKSFRACRWFEVGAVWRRIDQQRNDARMGEGNSLLQKFAAIGVCGTLHHPMTPDDPCKFSGAFWNYQIRRNGV